ncbi:MAG: hypothetical protein KU37_04080 [Sulfuricurvum sp. PC08-66]|nr:MAG: hypothetical protein KU37_04080 [Sulfuricurvum sp. PC08-66]
MKRLLLLLIALWIGGCTQTNLHDTPNTPNPDFPIVRMGQIDGATSVYTNSIIHLVFTKALYDIQEFNASVELIHLDSNTSVSLDYTLAVDGVTLSLTPSSFNYAAPQYLEANASYSIVLRTGLMFADYTSLGQEFTYEFQTGGNSDNNASMVKAQNIANGDANLSVHAAFIVRYDEMLNTLGATYTLNGDSNVTCSLGTDGRTLMCIPNALLPFDTNVTLEILGLKDMANNPTSFSVTATTQSAPSVDGNYTTTYATGKGWVNPNTGKVYIARYDDQNYTNFQATLDIYGIQEGITPLEFNLSTSSYGAIAMGAFYNNHLFLLETDKIIAHDLESNSSFFIYPYSGYTMKMAMNADRACLISTYSSISFYTLASENNYAMGMNESMGALDTATFRNCIVTPERIAYATSNNGVYRFDLTGASAIDTNIQPSDTDALAVGSGYIAAAGTTQIYLINEANPSGYTLVDAGVPVAQLEIVSGYLFALEANSSRIHLWDIQKIYESTIETRDVITAEHNITSFALYDHYLVTFGDTNETNATASQIIDIGAYVQSVHKDYSAGHTINKSRSYPYMQNSVVVAGNSLSFFNDKGEQYLTRDYSYSPLYNFNLVNDSNGSIYALLAHGSGGFSIAEIGLDTSGLPASVTPKLSMNAFATVRSVLGGRIGVNFHLYVGTTEGLLHYTIDTVNWNATLLSSDTTNFGAIFDMVSNNGTKVYVADYSNARITAMTLGSDGNYTLNESFTFSDGVAPRSLHIDLTTGHLFAALGEGGIIALRNDTFSYGYTQLRMPDYIMDVSTGLQIDYENNTSAYSLLATGLNSVSTVSFDANDTYLDTLTYEGTLDYARGGLYGGQYFAQYDVNSSSYTINGAIAFNRYGYTRFYTRAQMPYSFDDLFYANSPLSNIEFNTTTSTTQQTYETYYDPFF